LVIKEDFPKETGSLSLKKEWVLEKEKQGVSLTLQQGNIIKNKEESHLNYFLLMWDPFSTCEKRAFSSNVSNLQIIFGTEYYLHTITYII
jgi:hypothetical protein